MEPAQGNAAPDAVAGASAVLTAPKLKRGRRADPNRAPAGYLRRLADDLAAESLARQEAHRPASQGSPPEPLFRSGRWTAEAEAFAAMVLTPAEKRRRRTAELKKMREDEAARAAALLAFVRERKGMRAAAEKREAERKAAGVKLSYSDWCKEVSE